MPSSHRPHTAPVLGPQRVSSWHCPPAAAQETKAGRRGPSSLNTSSWGSVLVTQPEVGSKACVSQNCVSQICVSQNCAPGALQVLERDPGLGFTCGDRHACSRVTFHCSSCISSSEGGWAQRLGGALPTSRKGEGRAVALTQESNPGFGTESLCGWSDQRRRVGLGRGAPELFLSTYLEDWGPTRHALSRPGGLFWGKAGVSTESAPLLPADSQAHKWVPHSPNLGQAGR